MSSKQVLSAIERYSTALDLLDDYDHQTMKRPKGNENTYVLTYEDCREVSAIFISLLQGRRFMKV